MFEVSKETIPAPAHSSGGKPVYPFAAMEVGQHFDAPRDMGRTSRGLDRRQATISASTRGYCKKHNPAAKFTVRLIDENTVRCWRIA